VLQIKCLNLVILKLDFQVALNQTLHLHLLLYSVTSGNLKYNMISTLHTARAKGFNISSHKQITEHMVCISCVDID
jgi:hypothetical protein